MALCRSVSEPWQQTSNESEETFNQKIENQHFKMEGIQSLKSLIQKDDFKVRPPEAYFSLHAPGFTLSGIAKLASS